MATSKIQSLKATLGLEIRTVTAEFTIQANGNANTNLKTLIDNNIPSGKKFLSVAGYSTNDVYVVLSACRYGNSAYSLQLRNIATSERTTTVSVDYLCGKV